MKKNISINIGGIIFHIEEDGYEQLKNYLDSINTYFSSFDESKEIIEDIEGRIAEIFLAKLDEGKQIIIKEDVEELIATMGTTKDFDATIESEPKEEKINNEKETVQEEQPKEETVYEKAKRLYRDNKRRVIGGVASGLAYYFGVDSIWIRLLMIALLFNVFFWGLSSFIFISYIVLWIAIPGNDNLEEDKTVKKLFRNTDDQVLGGVASGISSYFGVDPVVMRVIFVVSIFLGGAGLIVYFILWIIVPEAKSITEKMQMQGEPVTLSNIEQNVKRSFKVKEGEESAFLKVLLFPFRVIALIFSALGEFLGPFLKFAVEALRIAAGVLLVFLGSVLMLAFTISLAVWLGVGGNMENWLYFGDFPVDEFFSSLGTIAVISSYFASIIPALLIALIGLSIILKRWVTKAYIGWSLFGLWIIGMIGLAVTIPQLLSNYSAEGSYNEEKTFVVGDAMPTLRLNDLKLKRYSNVDLEIKGHKERTFYRLKLDFESRGYSKTDARNNAEAVNYFVTRKGEDFFFDSDITFTDAPFRFQDVSATFYVPYNKVFQMDDKLKEILRNSLWMYDYSALDMKDNEWVFERDGTLNCLTCEKKGKRFYKSYEEDTKRGSDGGQLYQFEDFDEVKFVSMFDFEIERSDDYTISLEGDEDYLKEVSINQEGNELEIKYKKDWEWWKNRKPRDRIKVFITMPVLEHLDISGACEGKVWNFNNSDISFDIMGASEVWADISPNYLGADLNGASKLILVGTASELEVDLNGASKLDAFNFRVENVDVKASGASAAKVYAENELVANASGASTIRYRGSASVNSESYGLSSVKRD
ncbi:MAG: PspC domain-containing protein [Bacteroidota bacterium]